MSTYNIDKTINFGIELELVNIDRATAADAVASVIGGQVMRGYSLSVRAPDGRIWKVVRDASLSHHSGKTCEIVSPICTYSDIETVQAIARACRRRGAQANNTCGIHVHLDGARFNPKQAANLVRLSHKWDNFLTAALANQHRARYCKPTRTDLIEAIDANWRNLNDETLNREWYRPTNGGRYTPNAHHYNDTRYHAMNLHNRWYRGTIEFRHFNGTTHAGKIKSYIQLAIGMGSRALAASRKMGATRRPIVASKARYDFRVFLIHCGLIGPEFKTARLHLLANFGGAYNGEARRAA